MKLPKNITFSSILRWLDDNILFLLAAFLVAFIPLYPKIPVWSPIEQYIVRVRIEDFVLLLAVVVWFVQVLRRKVKFISPVFWWVLAYAIVGAISTLSAMFVTKMIPLQPLHVEKSWLHYFRYLEYFSFFFVVFSSIKKRRDALILLAITALTVVAISIYGYGQKYYYWPVYSTMNREFSKGVRLVLTPHARVQSTFAGHYDMAAYLVITLPIILALAYQTKKKKYSIPLHVAFWIGTWLLIVSASRTSFVAFLAAIFLVVIMTALRKANWGERTQFAFTRFLLIFVISGILFGYFGEDLNDRMSQVIDSNPQWHDTFHALNKERKNLYDDLIAGKMPSFLAGILPSAEPPKDAITTDQAEALGIITPTDERPVPAAENTPAKPKDVYVDVPDIKQVATKSADGSTQMIEVNNGPRIYSDNAIKYGLSMGIRLDTLWPNAIKGFLSNPLLGKGYATLNKESVDQFTEAESTDDNLLRTLGETGALGFITFYGCVMVIAFYAFRLYQNGNRVEKALGIGIVSATVGLLLNAIYIDVFASSKVALTFWGVAGLLFGYLALPRSQEDRPQLAPAPLGKPKGKR